MSKEKLTLKTLSLDIKKLQMEMYSCNMKDLGLVRKYIQAVADGIAKETKDRKKVIDLLILVDILLLIMMWIK